MTTPTPRPLDIAEIFPEMHVLAKQATRLHPRRGEPDLHASSIGGPFLWPSQEPWPDCGLPRMAKHERPITPEELQQREARLDQMRARRERLLADPSTPEEMRQSLTRLNQAFDEARAAARPAGAVTSWQVETPAVADPMIGLLQLRAADAPDIAFPDGTDLMQLLWCPHNHPGVPGSPRHSGPAPLLRWRRAADVGDVLAKVPGPSDDAHEHPYLPRPCTLSPERITEYPDLEDLPAALHGRVKTWSDSLDAERGLSYERDLSTAPGWKTGGWPSRDQDPHSLTCECGVDMVLLLTIASSEWGGRSWRPLEDRHFPDQGIEGLDVAEPTDVIVGRQGSLQLFWCPRDADHPLQMVTR